MSRSRSRLRRRLVHTAGLLFFGVWTVLPLYWIVVTSIKPNLLIYREASFFPSQLTGDHFAFVLTRRPFLHYVQNSMAFTLVTTAVAMVIVTLAFYAIVRFSFAGPPCGDLAVVVTYMEHALPALAVVALFAFTLSWNEFLYALVFIGSDSQKTLTLGLIGLVRGDTFPWGPMMAASLMGTLPPALVYLISQRWVVSGLAAGSVKG